MKKIINLHLRKRVLESTSIEKYFEEIVKVMRSVGSDVQIVTAPYPTTGLLNKILLLRYMVKFRSQLNHIGGDFHFLALSLIGTRYVLSVMDLVFMREKPTLIRLIFAIFWIYLPIKFSFKTVVISESVKKEIVELFPSLSSKLLVIPCCIHDDYFKTDSLLCSTGDQLQKQVLIIGTGPTKNLERMILALKDVDVKVAIVGTLKKHHKRLLDDNNILYENFVGIVRSEVIRLYKQSDLLLFVSEYEGFGLPIVEAQACGLPVVTSNIYSMPEVAGGAALIADPYKINQIKMALCDLLTNVSKRENLVKNGKLNAKRFTSTEIVKQWWNVYANFENY